MKYILSMVLIAAAANAAAAEWISLGTVPTDRSVTAYYDRTSIQRTAAGISVVFLLNFNVAQPLDNHVYRSVDQLTEIDCGRRQYRPIDRRFLSGNMASGNVVMEDTMSEGWRSGASGSPAARLIAALC